MAINFNQKLDGAIANITEKINQVTSTHNNLSQTVTELCSVVVREMGHNGLNPVNTLPGVTSGKMSTVTTLTGGTDSSWIKPR